ncbi:dynamin family protein [Rhodococcoides corynebacterioides]|uniref:dynamin family protein n=1 Tax=Rhodococcoides corynebacterioides TaxID=53972 RepID=UPI001C9A4E19|nr:dynamin family protein [Rhodococcus corynebacterioides]MBY6361593.1 dynamin family protein [Rhodococcus corynebacterioides]
MSATIDRARSLVAAARAEYAGVPEARRAVQDCGARLDEPLRIALAGSLKAGKSTLLNALVGQDIAPTDATECTRVVTWYRRGLAPSVTARYDGDRSAEIPVVRRNGRLSFDFGELTADRVDRLDVEWPARALARNTIVDTPGTSSLSRDVSERTLAMLTPDDAASGADAVVYLLRTLSAADTTFLGRINDAVGGESGPLGVIGVVSRADEIGAGRMDALLSAKDVAARFAGELERTGLCQAVVPVAGLLALGARTLRQSEFAALVALADAPPEDLSLAMLSADRFVRPDMPLPVDAETRAGLADRFGLFGIRLAVTLIRMGTRDSPALARELVERSGLDELRQVLDAQFGDRADQLKAHSALVTLDRILHDHPAPGAQQIADEVRRTLADTHGFRELRLIGRMRAREVRLPDDQRAALALVIGAQGMDAATRLGCDPDASESELRDAALAAVRTWRARSTHPLLDRFTASACEVAVRSAEGILAGLSR